MPIISVIIPCYNQGRYLAESIGSVLASDHDSIEIIVVDDGSSDPETCRILDSLDYPRTRLLRQQNQGLAAARNAGISAAAGRYILPLDADDRIGPRYISQAVAALERDQWLGIVYCRAEKFGAETGPWRLARFSRLRMMFGNLIFCSAVFRQEDWQRVGGYNAALRRGWEDWDFWLSLLEQGRTVCCLPLTGFYYRKQQGSMAAGMDAALKLELHRGLMARHKSFFGHWAALLGLALPLYYRLAGWSLYRFVKKEIGR